MGLLIFKERDYNDKTPFRKNEWHVGVPSRFVAPTRPQPASSDAAAANGRSPIRRDSLRRERRRIPDSARFISHIAAFNLGTNSRLGEELARRRVYDNTPDRFHSGSPIHQSTNSPTDNIIISSNEGNGRDGAEELAAALFSDAQPAEEHDNEDEQEQQRRRDQRRQSFGYVLARARARIATSRTGSPERENRWRVASPDTQRVIMQQIENQFDREQHSRLYVDGARESPDTILHMGVSRSDGLGDRRRSLSRENDRPSDVEENWNSLMETIPTIDSNLPSTSSSFASDSASSILSRNRPRSSLTNTTATGSRPASGFGTSSRRLPCPESEESISLGLPSYFHSVDPHYQSHSTSTGPSRTPTASLTHNSTQGPPVTQNQTDQSSQSSSILGSRSHGLDNLDELMDMLSNGTEVPPEMWASVGISPHLGVRGLAARLRRRSERL